MPNLVGRSRAVDGGVRAGVDGAGAWIDAQAYAPARGEAADAVELRHQVGVDVHAAREDGDQLALGEVGAGDADLRGQEAVGQRVLDLSGRAHVHSHGFLAIPARPALARRPGTPASAAPSARCAACAARPARSKAARRLEQHLLRVGEVVDQQRRAELARQSSPRRGRRCAGGRRRSPDPAAPTTAGRSSQPPTSRAPLRPPLSFHRPGRSDAGPKMSLHQGGGHSQPPRSAHAGGGGDPAPAVTAGW